MSMHVITDTTSLFLDSFHQYSSQFLQWGQQFFFVGLTITLVWMCLWNAFDKESFQNTMPSFIKEFFVIALFYTLMIHGYEWLKTIPSTAQFIGVHLGNQLVDPSSIVDRGIDGVNAIFTLLSKVGWDKKLLYGVVFAILALVVLFAFISIALDLALTIITIYFFITVSGFCLAFSVFSFTRAIARKSLDIVISYSMKLMALYLVVASGSSILKKTTVFFTANPQVENVFLYVATVFFFYLVCKNIPSQFAKLFSDVFQDTRGTDAAAIALSAISIASRSKQALNIAGAVSGGMSKGLAGLAKIAGSSVKNFGSHYAGSKNAGEGIMSSAGRAVTGMGKDAKDSASGVLTDHFKHIASKVSGGPGIADSSSDIPSFAQRMHKASSNVGSVSRSGSSGMSASSKSSTKSSKKDT